MPKNRYYAVGSKWITPREMDILGKIIDGMCVSLFHANLLFYKIHMFEIYVISLPLVKIDFGSVRNQITLEWKLRNVRIIGVMWKLPWWLNKKMAWRTYKWTTWNYVLSCFSKTGWIRYVAYLLHITGKDKWANLINVFTIVVSVCVWVYGISMYQDKWEMIMNGSESHWEQISILAWLTKSIYPHLCIAIYSHRI